jgi:hypothetical protein
MTSKKETRIQSLRAEYGIDSNDLVSNPSLVHQLRTKYEIKPTQETLVSMKSKEGWANLVEYSYNGVPLCHDGTSGKMIRFAPKLEKEFLGGFKPVAVEFNPNTIDFRTKDVVSIFRNFPMYLEFLRKNYALATVASIVGNKVDSPEFPFFNQIAWFVNSVGFVGSNPVFAQKLERVEASKKLILEGKAPLDLYLSDRFLQLYKNLLFERRATNIEITDDDRIIATSSDNFTRGTDITMTEFLNLAAAYKGIEIQSEKYVLSVNAGEEPAGFLTDLAKSSVRTLRKIPIVGKLI